MIQSKEVLKLIKKKRKNFLILYSKKYRSNNKLKNFILYMYYIDT